jgi:anti-sigma regulatory factor (Ser/Thr protein kinase)
VKATLTKRYEVPGSDFTQAGEASAKTKALLRQIGFDPDCIRRVAIAMYEGEINMVIHAHGGYAQVDIYADHVDILLKDTGPGIPDIDLAMKEGYSTAPDEVRSLGFGAGMGLSNMKKYSDEMQIETKLGVGTMVFITIRPKDNGQLTIDN